MGRLEIEIYCSDKGNVEAVVIASPLWPQKSGHRAPKGSRVPALILLLLSNQTPYPFTFRPAMIKSVISGIVNLALLRIK